MTREEVFDIWAPPAAIWSDWVKPVLFAHLQPDRAVAPITPMDAGALQWVPAADGSTVVVIDLPAADGLSVVAALAERGYRPIPLYNALPAPAGLPKDSTVCD